MMASDKEDLRQLSVDLKDVHTEEDGNSAEEGYERPLLKTTILMKKTRMQYTSPTISQIHSDQRTVLPFSTLAYGFSVFSRF